MQKITLQTVFCSTHKSISRETFNDVILDNDECFLGILHSILEQVFLQLIYCLSKGISNITSLLTPSVYICLLLLPLTRL